MAFNSDGYIMIDFTDVDFRRTNQTIEGLYKRCVDVIGTNKFILVINANGRTPLPATCSFTNNQYVIDTVIYMFAVSSNDNLFIRRNDVPASDIIDDSSISVDKTWSSLNTIEKLAPIDTIVNNPAVFNTSLELPLVECSTSFMASQEGTGDPSPSNVRPIHGFSEVNITRCGVNLWGGEAFYQPLVANGATLDTLEKTVSYTGAIASTIGKVFDKFKPNTQYTLMLHVKSSTNSNGNMRINYTDDTYQVVLFDTETGDYQYLFTTPNTKSVSDISFRWISGTTVIYYDEVCLLEGVKTIDDFEPYTGNTYTIQLGQEVYGAEVDIVNGVAHVEYITERIDHVDTVTSSYIKSDACDGFITLSNSPNISTADTQYNVLCNCFPRLVSAYGIWSRVGYPNMFQTNATQIHLNIANDLLGITDYTQETPSTAKAKMNEWLSNNVVIINRPLLTPFDIQLTPTQIETLIGNNTIFADTGNIKVSYRHLPIDLI